MNFTKSALFLAVFFAIARAIQVYYDPPHGDPVGAVVGAVGMVFIAALLVGLVFDGVVALRKKNQTRSHH